MEFTGERFTTDCVREIWYEHWHRYAFAQDLVAGKSVLDLACGEGYGSNLLAARAGQVIGVDVATATVEHAAQKYLRPNLRFEQGDATAIPLADQTIDVVVSFETLEHLAPQQKMLEEFRRVLKPDGMLIISTPDKRVYSDQAKFENEFHVKELYREEFEHLLSSIFPAVRMFGQKLLFQSAIWAQDETPQSEGGSAQAVTLADGKLDSGLNYEAMYLVALAAAEHSMLPAAMPSMHWFGDRSESVYQHYNGEIRKNIEAGTILAERDRELAALEATRPSFWQRLLGRRKQ